MDAQPPKVAAPWRAWLAAAALLGPSVATAQLTPPPAPTACEKPVYLVFDSGSMDVAPLVALALQRQHVRATFFAGMSPTANGDSLDGTWAPWWKARAAEGHAFAARTRDEVVWLGDERGREPQFRVRPTLGAFAGRTFTWSAAKYCENITQAADRLGHVTGGKLLPLFRAAGGRTSPKLLASAKACGYANVNAVPVAFLSAATPSAKGPDEKQVAQVIARVQPGDVVAAHLGVWSREVPQVPVGLDPLISGLKAQGFCFQTLREHPEYRDWIASRP